jgi:hypothetical protein
MIKDSSSTCSDDSRSIEQAIRAAGNFVQPTRDLRPRVMEAAKEHCGQRRTLKQASELLIFLGLFAAVMAPTVLRVTEQLRQAQGPSPDAILQEAALYSAQSGIGSNWGLSEAFSRLRQSQSQRFPTSTTTSRK